MNAIADVSPSRTFLKTRLHVSRLVSFSTVGCFILLLIGAAYYARSFVLPLVLATLISLTFLPIVRWLGRRGVPAGLSAISLVLVLAAIAAAAAMLLANPISQAVKEAPHIATALRDRFGALREPIAMISQASDQIRALAAPAGPDQPQTVVLAQPGLLTWAADTLTGIGTTFGATLILVIFLLSSSDLFLQKIVRAVPSLSDKKLSLRIVYDLQLEVSRYLLTISAINICFGIAIGTVMALVGMPNPLLWGVGATLLNYVPFLGAVTGIVVSACVALIAFPTLGQSALPPLGYLVIHTLESAFITPLVLGRRLELNAVAILVALAFCGWMWGIVGALIAVPLLVVVKVFCDHLPALATVGDFLSAETQGDADENARDPK